MSDIVQELRHDDAWMEQRLLLEAADEIERLRVELTKTNKQFAQSIEIGTLATAEIERLREVVLFDEDVDRRIRNDALEEAAKVAETLGVYPELNANAVWYTHAKRVAAAIRALKEKT